MKPASLANPMRGGKSRGLDEDYRSKFCRRRRYPQPTFSRLLFKSFGSYLGFYLGRNFHAVRLSKAGPPPHLPKGPVIFYSNHPSWWDPVVMFYLAYRYYPNWAGYAPMDAEALKKYSFFKRLGIFGVEENSFRGAATFLCTSWNVLSRPKSALWITAEGQFTDARRRPVRLRAGLAHLAKSVDCVTMIPLALEYPFWRERFPEALIRFGAPVAAGPAQQRSTREWTALFEQALEETMAALAIDAMDRNLAAFDFLLAGRAGVGGLYDMWRWLKAVVSGKPFRPEHTEESS
jgi:1-acyl-sn-glycerol-3-phosphate acyltransferase